MATTPMDIDSRPSGSGAVGPGLMKYNVVPATARISESIKAYRPTRHWQREYHGRPVTTLSLDFDDKGELLMSSESDETLQIYTVVDGKYQKTLASKKYGVKLAKFTHTSSTILYASTKENDDIRYLSTHDNSFIAYFKGHTAPVTSITMQPSSDNFVSTSLDNTLRLWDINANSTIGILHLHQPTLSAFDPSGNVMAVASPAAQTILLYDYRNYTKEPFANFDMLAIAGEVSKGSVTKNWTKLEFSNDGKSLLVGTTSGGHFVLDAFDGKLKSFLKRRQPGPYRLAPGEKPQEEPAQNGGSSSNKYNKKQETSGDCCFTPDGRFVLSANGGGGKNGRGTVSVYDTNAEADQETKVLDVIHELESSGKEGCDIVEFNPRWGMFATAGKGVEFWVPDRDAL